MKKTYTAGGDAAFVVNVKPICTLQNFATALAEESYNGASIDFKMLKKNKAMDILKSRICWHGRMGEYGVSASIGSDYIEDYNSKYTEAKEWVIKNYPYLTTKKDQQP